MKEQTAENIIEVGLDLFIKKGFNNVGLSEILRNAKIPKGSFYYYFKSKEDFGLKVIQHYSTQSLQLLHNYLSDNSKNGKQRILSFYQDMRDVYQNKQYTEGCLLGNCSTELADLKSSYANTLAKELNLWQVAIEQAIELGKLDQSIQSDFESKKLAAYILNNWEGALLRMKAEKTSFALDIFLEFLDDLL